LAGWTATAGLFYRRLSAAESQYLVVRISHLFVALWLFVRILLFRLRGGVHGTPYGAFFVVAE